MAKPACDDQSAQYTAVYLPEFEGITPAMVPITSSGGTDLLQKALNAKPSGKRLSRIICNSNPNRNLWEAGKGWIPQASDSPRQDYY